MNLESQNSQLQNILQEIRKNNEGTEKILIHLGVKTPSPEEKGQQPQANSLLGQMSDNLFAILQEVKIQRENDNYLYGVVYDQEQVMEKPAG